MKGKRCLKCIGEIEKNEMIKGIMKRQVFLSSSVLEFCFCFIFTFLRKRPPQMLLFMLFIQLGKRLNCRLQMFLKTGAFFQASVVKNFALLTSKHL